MKLEQKIELVFEVNWQASRRLIKRLLYRLTRTCKKKQPQPQELSERFYFVTSLTQSRRFSSVQHQDIFQRVHSGACSPHFSVPATDPHWI